MWLPQKRYQGSLYALWRQALKWFKRALKKMVRMIQTFYPNLNVLKRVEGWGWCGPGRVCTQTSHM